MTTLNLTEIIGEPSSWTLKNGPAAGQEMLTFTVKDDKGTTYQINRKPTSGPPQLGPDEFEITPPKQGTTFPPKLKRLQSGGQGSQNASQGSSDTPSPEFWAQKDRRIARAGVLQAVVASGQVAGQVAGESLAGYVAEVNRITDALLASLDERTPHPSGDGQDFGREAQGTPTQRDAASANASGNPAKGFTSSSQQDTFQRLLKSNGLDHANLMQVMAYAESLPTPAISIAIDGLRDNADAMCTRLLQAAGKWAKEHDFVPADTRDLPSAEQVGIGAADDDIPFAASVI